MRSPRGTAHGRDGLRVAGPAAVLFAVALLISCTTTNLASNRTGRSDYATISIKDYTVVGIVRVASEEVTQRGFLGIANSRTGSQVTYDMLVGEAKSSGPSTSSTSGSIARTRAFIEKYAYTANALAIKYTQAAAGK